MPVSFFCANFGAGAADLQWFFNHKFITYLATQVLLVHQFHTGGLRTRHNLARLESFSSEGQSPGWSALKLSRFFGRNTSLEKVMFGGATANICEKSMETKNMVMHASLRKKHRLVFFRDVRGVIISDSWERPGRLLGVGCGPSDLRQKVWSVALSVWSDRAFCQTPQYVSET